MSDYLPPVVAEIILRTQGFSKGVAQAKSDMAEASSTVSGHAKQMASDVDQSTRKVEESSTRMSSRVGNAMQALGSNLGVVGAPMEKLGERMTELDTKGKSLTNTLAEVGKVATLGGIAGFAGAAYEGVKAAEKFQTSLAQIAADSNQKNARQIGSAFLDTMGKSAYSANEMAQSFAQVSQKLAVTEGHFLSAAQASNVMAAASDLAEGAQTSLGNATNAVAQVMQAYGLRASQAAQAADVLYSTSRATGSGVNEIAQAMGRLHARLGQLAPSLQDVGGLMLAAAQHGLTGSRGIMVMQTALQTLVNGGKTTSSVLRALGVDVFNQQGKFVGLQAVVSELHSKFAGMTEAQQEYAAKALFGASAANVMLQVVQSGPAAFAKDEQAASKAGAAHQAAAAQANTLSHQVEVLKATLDDLATRLGSFLIPKLEAVAQAVNSVIGWFQKHQAAAEALAGVISGVLGAAIAAFIAQKAQGLISAVGQMGQSLLNLGSRATATAATITTADQEIVASADSTAAGVDAALGSTGIGLVIVGLGVAAGELMTHWSQVMSAMSSAAQAMASAVTSALNGVISVLNSAISLFNSTVGQITGDIGQLNSIGGGGGGASGMFDTAHGLAPYQAPSFSTASGGTPPVPTSGSAAQRIAGALAAQGFSKTAIAGILSNLGAESGGQTLSGISPTATNPTSGAFGIAQWLGSRLTNLQSYAAVHQESPSSLTTQIQYLIQELRTSYHSTFTAIQNAKSPQQAAALFETTFEKAGGAAAQNHQTLAAQAYQWLTAGGGKSAATSGAGNSAVAALMNAAASGKSSSKSAAAKAIRELLYTNPLPGMTSIGRIDEGLDFSATPGSAVNAIGAGVITRIISNWFNGQPMVQETLSQGPNKGQIVYYAEQLNALVKQGQQVAAGQRIGTVAAHGTGLELGFGSNVGPHYTLAAATTGYHEGQVTPAGQAFAKFFQSIKGGVYTSTSDGITSGGGANFGMTFAQLLQQYTTTLVNQAQSLVTKLGSMMQAGSPTMLERTLGVSTGGGLSTKLAHLFQTLNPVTIEKALAAGKQPSTLDKSVIPLLEKASARSPMGQHVAQLVAELRGAGQGGTAKEVLSQWGASLATLAQQLYAMQATKNADSLKLQATQETDRTKLTADSAKAQLQVITDSQNLTVIAMQSAATAIKDQTALITSQFQAIAQGIQDQTQLMADASNAMVTGINDRTQTQVDLLGEKGLYGLNLLAQQQQVQLDVMKTGFDQQIAAAQQNVDAVKAQWNTQISALQVAVNQTQIQQDQLVAAAQQNAATVQLHADQLIATATAKADTVQLASDIKVTMAQTAVDLSATAPAAQQRIAQAALTLAQAQQSRQMARANATLSGVQNAAAQMVQIAQNAYTVAQQTAATAEANAQETLATAQGQASVAEATASQQLQAIQDMAAQQEASAQAQISLTQAQEAALERGGGTFNPYSTLMVGGNGMISLINGGGPLPWNEAGGGGSSTQLTQNINMSSQADPQLLASELAWLMRPYLTTSA